MENKKGQILPIIIFIAMLFLLLFAALILVIGGSVVDWTFNEVVPEVSNLGVVGDANLTEYAGYTITPVNSVVQDFTWLSGVFISLGIIVLFGLSFVLRMSGNKWLMGLFFVLVFLLIIVSIFISNIYEEFYSDPGDLGTILHEYTLGSWLILYSPMIFCIVAFIGGIIIFTGEDTAGGYV